MMGAPGWRTSLLGIAAFVSFAAAWVSAQPFSQGIRLAADDTLFWREGGPRIGARPARADAVVVEIAQKDVERIGHAPTVQDDLRVYANLLAAGAKAVGDVRLLAGSGSEPRDFLAMLEQVQPAPAIFRDVWLPNPERGRRFVAHDPLSIAAEWQPTGEARWYPILAVEGGEMHETLALALARVTLGLGRAGDRTEDARLAGVDAVRIATLAGRRMPRLQRLPFGERGIEWAPFPLPVNALSPAAIRIDYGVSPREVKRLSYADVWDAPPAALASGSVAIVGNAIDIEPGHVTPVTGERESTAIVTALAWQTIVDGRTLRAMTPLRMTCAILALALAGAVATGTLSRRNAAMAILAVIGVWAVATVSSFRGGSAGDLVFAPSALVATAVLASMLRWRHEEAERRRVNEMFGRYVPRDVVARVIQNVDAMQLGGSKREITVLFSDVRGFTKWSEALPPDRVVDELNGLLSKMIECAFRHGGTVDKFMGDAVMVLFNAPLDQPDHARRALRCALDMQLALHGHASGLSFGIGIHSGEAVVGNIGTAARTDYTAIGQTVNLASRLCDAALPGEIVVSAATRSRIGDETPLRARDAIRVKGVDGEVQAFAVERSERRAVG